MTDLLRTHRYVLNIALLLLIFYFFFKLILTMINHTKLDANSNQ